MALAGMDIARFNFSHGDHEEQKGRVDIIKSVRDELGIPIAMLLDTKGPEIRTGVLKDDIKLDIKDGQKFTLTTRNIVGNENEVSITYSGLPADVSKGNIILIDDGLIELHVEEVVNGTDIVCKVINGGLLGQKKGVNVPNVSIRLPAITDKDKDDILSIGIIGLMKAVDSYQISANNKLATYAARCIENEILMTLRANKNKRNLVHLQSPIATDKDGNEMELLDFIEDKDVDLYKSYENRKIQENLDKALKTLSTREFDIISRRYGLTRDAQTQKEIASELKISRSYVSRIEKRGLLKLYFLLKDEK